MKLSINQSELLNALTLTSKGIASSNTLPVLSGVYVKAAGDGVTFQTTNNELSVQYETTALVEEEGAAVLPGKLISDIVKNLPDAAVHIEVQDFDAIIACESSSFSIRSLDPFDFPAFPQVAPEQQVTIPFEVFSSMARKVSRMVSKDESRMILTGVLLEVEDGRFKMVSTDSYRLAVAETPLEGDVEDFNAVLTGSFVSDLAALPKTGEDISLALAENQIIVKYHETTFINRRLEGRYPNYKQLIPSTYDTRCVVDRASLASAVRRASLLDRSGAHVRFSVDPGGQVIQLSTVTKDVGSTQETVSSQVEGAEVEIGFNSSFVSDGLSVMESKEVSVEIQSARKPGIIKGDDQENFLYLVMPVRI